MLRAQLAGMAEAVVVHIPADPVGIGLLRPTAVVAEADALAQAIEEARLGGLRGVRVCGGR